MYTDGMRVLLVEDNPGDARLVEWYLSKPGCGTFPVTRAERLSDALRELAATRFDLVLLDLSLPDSTGLETVRTARAAAGMTPIVVMTGLDDEETALAALRVGAQDYLVKGKFDSYELTRSLRYSVERERAELTLRQTKEALEAIIAATHAAVLSLDAEGHVLTWNESAEHMFGWTAAETYGRTPPFIPAEGKAEFADLLKQVLAGQPVSELETRRRRKDDTPIDVSLSASRVRDADGSATGAVVVLSDVTERNRAAAALRESEEGFRNLFDEMSSGVAVCGTHDQGASFVVKSINRGAERLDSVRREQVVGRSIQEAFPRIEAADLLTVLQRVWLTGQPERLPVAWYEDGRIAGWRENYVYRLPSRDVATVYDDVTTRMRAEAALRESEQRLLTIAGAAKDAIMMMDDSGIVTFWNSAAEAMFGSTAEEALGRNLHELLAPVRFRDAQTAAFPRFLATGEGEWIGKTVELTAIRKDDSEVPAELSLSAIKIGDKWHSVGIVRDITERKRAEAELAKYRDHLEELVRARTRELAATQERLVLQEKLATVGRVAGSVAHELRNPLGAIRNASCFLQLTVAPKLEGKPLKHLRFIEECVVRANQAITMILDFTQARAARAVPCALHSILQQVVAEVSLPDSIEVCIGTSPRLPQVLVDSGQVAAIFRNLLTNAAQAMPSGGTVTVQARAVQNKVVVDVIDTGMGIKPEHMAFLFKPLFTTKDIGIGLGLSICKGFTEANKGTISVVSEVGKGTTFTVALPTTEEPAPRALECDAVAN
jgi:PAS domain S-box-containing protein